ncbi:metalloregulator ArsR/SmtB family transcription factor [candidate division GN15 bacterium]|nr:metalloregulator ArsR/SmtB family transcription factor [candidate division GN15 bacterium]
MLTSGKISENARSNRRQLQGVAAAFSALGDPNRLRIVLALRQGELCVCQIVALLELANSTVSRHLQIIRETGIIESYKQGRWVYYRMATSDEGATLVRALLPMLSLAEASAQAAADARRLARIQRINPEELCRTQLTQVK